jgi:hypothetical protein
MRQAAPSSDVAHDQPQRQPGVPAESESGGRADSDAPQPSAFGTDQQPPPPTHGRTSTAAAHRSARTTLLLLELPRPAAPQQQLSAGLLAGRPLTLRMWRSGSFDAPGTPPLVPFDLPADSQASPASMARQPSGTAPPELTVLLPALPAALQPTMAVAVLPAQFVPPPPQMLTTALNGRTLPPHLTMAALPPELMPPEVPPQLLFPAQQALRLPAASAPLPPPQQLMPPAHASLAPYQPPPRHLLPSFTSASRVVPHNLSQLLDPFVPAAGAQAPFPPLPPAMLDAAARLAPLHPGNGPMRLPPPPPLPRPEELAAAAAAAGRLEGAQEPPYSWLGDQRSAFQPSEGCPRPPSTLSDHDASVRQPCQLAGQALTHHIRSVSPPLSPAGCFVHGSCARGSGRQAAAWWGCAGWLLAQGDSCWCI